MDFDDVITALNKLLLEKQPETFNSSWILRHSPACYRFIRKRIRTELGKIDWDAVTCALESEYQRRWAPPARARYRSYENANEVNLILNRYRNKLYVFIAPIDFADQRIRDKIAIHLVRVAQAGNLLAKAELFRLVRYTIDEWLESCHSLSRWKGYDDQIREQVEGCVRRYRYTGSFITYLFRTLEYAGRGICPIVIGSLDEPISIDGNKRRAENVVRNPETNANSFYVPKMLRSFDSKSQFGI